MHKNQSLESANFADLPKIFKLNNELGSIEISRYGGQLLSYIPKNQKDLFWLSNQISPPPAAIRGGVPICWPWFAKQGIASRFPQHGPVRNMPWKVLESFQSAQKSTISLIPEWNEKATGLSADEIISIQNSKKIIREALGVEWHELDCIQTIELTNTLKQSIKTKNNSGKSIALTQALHSYFAVADVMNCSIKGLENCFFTDKLKPELSEITPQINQLSLNSQNLTTVDRIYHLPQHNQHQFQIHDGGQQRIIEVQTQGCLSVVVWNPGSQTASGMADVGEHQWRQFICLEAANALPHSIVLAPLEESSFSQTIQTHSYTPN